MEHKITERQLVALLAAYHGESAWAEPSGVYGKDHAKAGDLVWRGRTNMGGAVRRMTEDLRQRGFISNPDHYERREKKPYADSWGVLTFIGYQAIEERLKAGKLPVVNKAFNANFRDPESRLPEYDFNEKIALADLQVRKMERGAREQEMQRLREEEHEATRARDRALAERNARDRLAKLRTLFTERGLADNWSDADLLDFADKVASI